MANEKIIVLVSDRGDSKHGEISVLDDPRKAERLVETLLEAGFDEDRIRVFTGQASEFEVNHRPVVALANEGAEVSPTAATEPQVGEPQIEVPVEEPTGDETATAEPVVEPAINQAATPEPSAETPPKDGDTPDEAIAEKSEDEEVPAEAAASVKFSSLFRSA